MFSSGTLLKAGLVVCGLSFLFQLLASTCPGWLVVIVDLSVLGNVTNTSLTGFGSIYSYSSVWYVRVCIKGAWLVQCSSSFYHEHRLMGFKLTNVVADLREIDWVEAEVELTLALALCIGAAVVAGYNLYRGSNSKMACERQMALSAIAAGLIMVSGILIVPPVIKIGIAGDKARHESSAVKEVTGFEFVRLDTPWTIPLACVAVVLSFLCSVIFLVASCKQNEQTIAVVTPGEYDTHPAPCRVGHPPSPRYYPQFSQEDDLFEPPSIGGRDVAPLRFETGRMVRETTMFVPSFNPNLTEGEVAGEDSDPPPYDSNLDAPPPYDSNSDQTEGEQVLAVKKT